MKLPAKQEKDIIEGLLPLLKEEFEECENIKSIKGRDLINIHGITKDKDSNQILPGQDYVYPIKEQISVNHERRLRNAIDRATTMQGLKDDLARYLIKHGISKQAVTDSIPDHLRNKKQS